MIKIFLLSLLLLSFHQTGLAQQICPETLENTHYDEYFDVPFSTEKRRLNKAATALKSFPEKSIIIVVYGKDTKTKSVTRRRVKRSERYLIKKHHIEKKRIISLKGANSGWLQMKLFVVDQNSEGKFCNETLYF